MKPRSERHAFTPSRPGGTVCVAPVPNFESDGHYTEPCGYPAGWPCHGQVEIDLSPRPAAYDTADFGALRVQLEQLAALSPGGSFNDAGVLIAEVLTAVRTMLARAAGQR